MKPFDLQVNGYAGVDFNHLNLTADDLHLACQRLKEDGCGAFLATIITDSLPAMEQKLHRLATFREADALARQMISGLHIEGPFLNPAPGYIGAHPKGAARPADPDTMARLLDASGGLTRLVTLAPEQDPRFATTRFLADQGITVAAGHCNPDLDQLKGAIDSGLHMFTHLGNGCPMELHRHDNIIQRALSLSDQLWLCFIPDGVHVPFLTLTNYLKAANLNRVIMVSDAISAASLGPGLYSLGDWDIKIGDDLVARSPDESHFIGSTVTWPRILKNLEGPLGFSENEIEQTTILNPRAALAASANDV